MKITSVVDLGPGDGGKGGVVHKLASHNDAKIVIKIGGAQGSHGVDTGTQKFAFSQWGCGTLEGIRTHISNRMIISPEGLLNEADGLRYIGVSNAFDLLTVDADAICSTQYHGIVSRIKELARGKNQRGTIGSGIGESYRFRQKYPELTIYAKDLKIDQSGKLRKIRELCIAELESILPQAQFLPEDKAEIKSELFLLKDDKFLQYNIDKLFEAGSQATIVDDDYLKKNVFDNGYNAVVESSHGILTDNEFGFRPHVSAIRTLPKFINQMLRAYGYNGLIETIGVHRAYSIRHGAGPLPTADHTMAQSLLPGSHKLDNRYQGSVRVGPLDFVLLRYAIEAAEIVDKLAITWFDQILVNKQWPICDKYDGVNNLFHSPNRIKINTIKQEQLCEQLLKVRPVVTQIEVPQSVEEQVATCRELLQDKLGIPLSLISFGPTLKDKKIEETHEHRS